MRTELASVAMTPNGDFEPGDDRLLAIPEYGTNECGGNGTPSSL